MSHSEPALAHPPLLETKWFVPGWRAGSVARPRLLQRLDQGSVRALTLISAPAGFGKTTLLAEWLAAGGRTTAWVSLDSGDSDPSLFWAYVLGAVRSARPEAGENALALLRAPQPPPTASILTSLINDIAATEEPLVLVLDDYHAVDSEVIHQGVGFLIDHRPPQLHLVISSRSDPPLPISRWRARGEMTELRAADLRFTEEEATTFLNRVMGLDLTVSDVSALENRTEGWVAGLQLAALSMRDLDDVSGFVAAFAGDSRYIVDYLVEEVLSRLSPSVRDFLLQTSILEHLSSSLCDEVTGRSDSREMLANLERGNLFVIPLDDRRHWFRYHHLFADVLKAHLRDERPSELSLLHRRGSEWYRRQGLLSEAIGHAIAAQDFHLAADAIESAEPSMRRTRQEATLLRWYQMLPDELISSRPLLSIGHAFALLSNGQIGGVEQPLRNAERWLRSAGEEGWHGDETGLEMEANAREALRRLPGEIAIARAGLALARGELLETAEHARKALTLVPHEDLFWRGAASSLLGLVAWSQGELDDAYRLYHDGMAHLQTAGYVSDAVGGSTVLADIRVTQGRLREAMAIYERGLRLAIDHGVPEMRGTADMYVGMSELLLARGASESARRLLQISRDLGELTGFPRNVWRWRLAMALIREAEGDRQGAIDLLSEAEDVYVSDFHPDARPIAAWKARIWIRQGRVDRAQEWARARGLETTDDLSYLSEFEYLTLARMLISRYRNDPRSCSVRPAM
ncbi:MAG: AAA family ATPase, partial [Thermomicrobiales bacterium]